VAEMPRELPHSSGDGDREARKKENPAIGGASKILWLIIKAILRTGRPLTIACHMKKKYDFFLVSIFSFFSTFLVVSIAFFVVSAAAGAAAAEESTVVGAAAAVESVVVEEVAVESVAVFSSELPPSLQATKEPIAKTNNSFFIVPFFVY